MHGPVAHYIKRQRGTLTLPTKGVALCTPSYVWISESISQIAYGDVYQFNRLDRNLVEYLWQNII